MTPEELRRDGHRLIDFIADYRAGIEQRPVMSQVEPGAVKAQLRAAPPEQPEPFEAVPRDVGDRRWTRGAALPLLFALD